MTRIIDKIQSRRKHAGRHVTTTTTTTTKKVEGVNQNVEENTTKEGRSASLLPEGWYYSFEFFPPKTEAGLDNLLTRMDRMSSRLDPLFVDVTWGAEGSTAAKSMAVASYAQRYCGVDVLLHLTCTGATTTREQLARFLDQAKSCGVHNILALRGDPTPQNKTQSGSIGWQSGDVSGGSCCDRAIDLVRLIRTLHGDTFGIAVAGHPEGHPSSSSSEDELDHLQQKMEAGADFIITQFFYDANLFLDYVKRCRARGITCPILPGIMPIQSYSSFVRMTKFCNISVPSKVMELLEPIKHDDEAVKDIGCEISADICRRILTASPEDGGVDGVHFYTLNLERSVTRILMNMGAIDLISPQQQPQQNYTEEKDATKHAHMDRSTASSAVIPSSGRPLPWRPSALQKRSKEEIRPINWANRPKSYVMRTEDWDEFPNGRWGDATSPAFGELSDLSHFYSFTLGSEDDRRAMLGETPTQFSDVYEVFARYVEGDVPHLPWCDTPLQPESFLIQQQLAALNRTGFLTVNSQPAVNGLPSTHPSFGWGGKGGFVYQKAYCECFVSPENAKKLVSMVSPSMNLYAVNHAGEEIRVDMEEGGVTALTWGVFPNREILQPTIFDPSTFLVWAEEAFSLWTSMWLNLYEVETDSYDLIETIRDSFYLVAIIDNDFMSSDSLWNALLKVGDVKVSK